MIGKKIRELREAINKTQADLAKYIGIEPQTIYKYEKGINEPDLETTKKIANYFNVSMDYLTDNKVTFPDTYIKKEDIQYATHLNKDVAKLNKIEQQAIEKEIKDIAELIIEKHFRNK